MYMYVYDCRCSAAGSARSRECSWQSGRAARTDWRNSPRHSAPPNAPRSALLTDLHSLTLHSATCISLLTTFDSSCFSKTFQIYVFISMFRRFRFLSVVWFSYILFFCNKTRDSYIDSIMPETYLLNCFEYSFQYSSYLSKLFLSKRRLRLKFKIYICWYY